MIDKIRIRNYKSIVDLTLELGRVNVIIGTNGCGKSNDEGAKEVELLFGCQPKTGNGKSESAKIVDDIDKGEIEHSFEKKKKSCKVINTSHDRYNQKYLIIKLKVVSV